MIYSTSTIQKSYHYAINNYWFFQYFLFNSAQEFMIIQGKGKAFSCCSYCIHYPNLWVLRSITQLDCSPYMLLRLSNSGYDRLSSSYSKDENGQGIIDPKINEFIIIYFIKFIWFQFQLVLTFWCCVCLFVTKLVLSDIEWPFPPQNEW